MKKFSEIFKEKYYQKMLTPGHPANPVRNRADSFLKVFELLEVDKHRSINIVETGCMRRDHGEMCFGDDGASTFLLNEFLNYQKSLNPHASYHFSSVDINQSNVDYANEVLTKSKYLHNPKVYCDDSVHFIGTRCNNLIDLLYLDSYDIERNNPHPSQLHHLKELCAAMPHLKKGSIVVIDDHNPFFTNPPIGKGNYVKSFMEDVGATKIFEDYQIGWVL